MAEESEGKSERFGEKRGLKRRKWAEDRWALCRDSGSAMNTDYTEGEPEEMNDGQLCASV